MTKYFLQTVGLALLWAVPLLGQSQAGDGCCDKAGCCQNAACCQNAGCCQNGGCCDQGCCNCCPHCGCKLVPTCQIYYEPLKVTVTKHTCCCKEICIPGVSCCCDKCGCGEGGCCKESCCNNCDPGCGHCCKCCVREVHKLYKYPCSHQECVKKCSVCWTCPHCGCCPGECCESQSTAAPAATTPAPAPLPKAPAAPRTTHFAPRLSEIGS